MHLGAHYGRFIQILGTVEATISTWFVEFASRSILVAQAIVVFLLAVQHEKNAECNHQKRPELRGRHSPASRHLG